MCNEILELSCLSILYLSPKKLPILQMWLYCTKVPSFMRHFYTCRFILWSVCTISKVKAYPVPWLFCLQAEIVAFCPSSFLVKTFGYNKNMIYRWYVHYDPWWRNNVCEQYLSLMNLNFIIIIKIFIFKFSFFVWRS